MSTILSSFDRQLLQSSQEGRVNEVVSLLERGANVNCCNDYGTPLHYAALYGHLECIKALLDSGAEVNKTNFFGFTPLHDAAGKGGVECIRALLNSGAGVDTPDNYGNTPMHYAALYGQLECIKALLDSGAEVNRTNMFGFAPLHDAAGRGGVECIRALLDSGAEVDTPDNDGNTPLHCAASMELVECIKALLVKGAEVNAQDKTGNAPLHCAAFNGHVECIKTLLASGAMVTIKNTRGQTALDIALREGHQNGADAIRSHSRRTSGDDQQGGHQQPDQNSSGSLQPEIEELRTQLKTARAKNYEYAVLMACVTGQEDVIAAQDLATLEPLLAKVDLGCLMKAVLQKRVQRELNQALTAASVCGVCLSAPKDTSLDPCGHTICRSCSDLIQLCPICRQTIAERRRVFL
eukprot:gene711-biopygen458